MTDLFSHTPAPAPVGRGNAHFLADLAAHEPDDTMRKNFQQGRYPDLHKPSLPAWRKLAGRG